MEYTSKDMLKSINLFMRKPICNICGKYKNKNINVEMTHGNFTGWINNSYCELCERDEILIKEKIWNTYLKVGTNE